MQMYVQTDFVGPKALKKLEASLKEFKEYVSQFPAVIKLTICPIGSFCTGLGSREGSCIDLIVCMDGGQLTQSLNGDQLALALSKGLTDWSELKALEPIGDGSSLLLLSTKTSNPKLRIHTCKPSTFPFNHLHHSQLFTSYAMCDSRAPVVIALIKHWASFTGHSKPVVTLACPFSGFHWTILTLYFLIESDVIPNLHDVNPAAPDPVRVVYGPRPERDSFHNISDTKSARKLTEGRRSMSDDPFQLCGGFFDWLSSVDLLNVIIDIREAGKRRMIPTDRKGWIVVADPVQPGINNTIRTDSGQKSQVEFAMKLRKTAKVMAEKLRSANETTFFNQLLSRTTDNGSSHKLDKAVP